MANTKSAAKRARQGGGRRLHNASVTSALKSRQKKLHSALAAGRLDEARSEYASTSAALDKAAKRGIIHKNSANRRKSALNRALRSSQGTGAA
jgi:small subunit ribosomal protein S20